MLLRQLKDRDLESLYAISVATGHLGGDASHLYEDQRLMGHIYSAPYCTLLPEYGFVVEDDDGVAGFAVGAPDTRAWEDGLEAEWWPALRAKYPAGTENGSADGRRIRMIHNPSIAPEAVVTAFPAHLHLNLLPRAQGKGWGKLLFRRWRDAAADRGVSAFHVGVNRGNARALRFWRAVGFVDIDEPDLMGGRTAYLGYRREL